MENPKSSNKAVKRTQRRKAEIRKTISLIIKEMATFIACRIKRRASARATACYGVNRVFSLVDRPIYFFYADDRYGRNAVRRGPLAARSSVDTLHENRAGLFVSSSETDLPLPEARGIQNRYVCWMAHPSGAFDFSACPYACSSFAASGAK